MNNFLRFSILLSCICFWMACQSNTAQKTTAANITSTSTAIDGQQIFRTNCAMCHGRKGKLGLAGAAKLNKSTMPIADIINIVKEGKGKMIGFKHVLNTAEIEAVATYILTFRQ